MRELLLYFVQCIFKLLIVVVQFFVIRGSVICQLPIRFGHFDADLAVVMFDGLLEVVDVNELNVELIVEVFNFQKNVSVGLGPGQVLEAVFKLTEFVSVRTQCLPPGIAFF
jgi:hypothetical protein